MATSNRLVQLTPLVLALALGACSMAPTLKLPEVPMAASFKEAAPWVAGKPADAIARDAWWTLYGDADLDDLQQRLIKNSPDLAAALARYSQARAIDDSLHSGLFPTVNATGGALRLKQSETAPLRVLGPNSPNEYNANTLGLSASYELDLWGRVRNTVDAGDATRQAAQADLQSARLSLQAQLADNYIALRGLDRQLTLLADTVSAYDKALELTQSRYKGGVSSGLDVARAKTQAQTTRSQYQQVMAQRAVLEHAIAALVGESASSFTIGPRKVALTLPDVPFDVPSTLLQRRPDIAAAQRRVVAANANVGVARSAFFPSVTLGGTLGYASKNFGNFIGAPNTVWSIGPSAVLALFDAGRRKAEVNRTKAVLDETGAVYRGVVLGAFAQVEDNLALLKHYRDAAESQQAAVVAAQDALDHSNERYHEGAVNYLDVVVSQTTALQAQRDLLDLETRQRRASVQLIRALGGGWSAGELSAD
ncbi:MAG TPA: efflux transporter outer membrane subunit [Burkholderiaceae bacterium]